MLSSRGLEPELALLEEPEDRPDELTLEAADRLAPGLALGPLASDIGLGRRVVPDLGQGDHVERPVELAVATP